MEWLSTTEPGNPLPAPTAARPWGCRNLCPQQLRILTLAGRTPILALPRKEEAVWCLIPESPTAVLSLPTPL
uniref:Uncharacterized protein n=1 Tax=Sphaerodactylus townsendi TaxID=933632 RepID=A0ACB8G9U7_9SAUR